MFSQDAVIEAFKIYAKLSAEGEVMKDDVSAYIANDEVRGLVTEFAKEVDCTIISAGEVLYLVPLTKNAVFHITNDQLKREYLPSRSLNMDMYLMYLLIIIMIGEFYDSYQTTEPTRDFITVAGWLDSANRRIESLKGMGMEKLAELEMNTEYNWVGIVEKWDAMDNIRENVVRQTAHSNVRISYIQHAKRFMEAQHLLEEIGQDELRLTQKAKVIIQKYYMEYEYNRGILEIIYQFEQEGGADDAGNI